MENQKETIATGEEISAKELIKKIQSWLKFLLSRWYIILLFTAAGGVLGIIKSLNTKKQYLAECIFTLDESSGSMRGSPAASGLALLGFGGNSEGGLFQGKNLIWLYSSRQMLQQSLLTPPPKGSRYRLFIDWFFAIDEKGKQLNTANVKFPSSNDSVSLNAEQNSLMAFAVARIKAKYLSVGETKNTDNFITVSVKADDEIFAREFSETVIKTVNNYYISNKTQKLRNEIAILQRKTESYKGEMNTSMFETAEASDATPYPNPNQQVLRVGSQKSGVGIKVNSELYVEMVKTLEANKMTLARETPLIQVIEEPVFPLPVIKTPIYMVVIIWSFITALITIAILTVIRVYKIVMSRDESGS